MKSYEITDYVSGCCLAISWDLINKLNGFNESFNMYSEDVDLCIRAKKLNAKCYVVTESVIWHKISKSIGGNLSFKKNLRKLRSTIKLINLHSNFFNKLTGILGLVIISIIHLPKILIHNSYKNMNKYIKPNFFIVGAPKCGTTSIYSYLSQHPQVFMSKFKEPHFFGKDLTRKGKLYNFNEESYIRLFKNSNYFKVKGEASTFYLYSKEAAKEIHSFNPNSKILILLREPTEMVYSMHSQYIHSQNEDVLDFKKALNLEQDRLKGYHIPQLIDLKEKIFYKDYIKKMPNRIKNYFDIFGRSNVHITLLDDLKNDCELEYKKIIRFLGVDETFIPNFEIYNTNKKVKYLFIQKIIKMYGLALGDIRKRFWSNKPIGIIKKITELNTINIERNEMDFDLRKSLKKEFLSIIDQIEDITFLDLSNWKIND